MAQPSRHQHPVSHSTAYTRTRHFHGEPKGVLHRPFPMFRPARRYLIPVGGAAAAYGAYTWLRPRSKDSADPGMFTIPIRSRSSDNTIVTKELPLPRISQAELENKLTRYAASYSIPRADVGRRTGRWRYETAAVASNDPIEDAHAEMIVRPGEPGSQALLGSPKAAAASAYGGDTLFFAIMDGHSGFNTSRLLAKT